MFMAASCNYSKNISLGREGSVLMFLFIGYFINLYLGQSREGAYRKC